MRQAEGACPTPLRVGIRAFGALQQQEQYPQMITSWESGDRGVEKAHFFYDKCSDASILSRLIPREGRWSTQAQRANVVATLKTLFEADGAYMYLLCRLLGPVKLQDWEEKQLKEPVAPYSEADVTRVERPRMAVYHAPSENPTVCNTMEEWIKQVDNLNTYVSVGFAEEVYKLWAPCFEKVMADRGKHLAKKRSSRRIGYLRGVLAAFHGRLEVIFHGVRTVPSDHLAFVNGIGFE